MNLPDNFGMNHAQLEDIIVRLYTKSKTELMEEALGEVSLDNEKPIFFYRRLSRKLADLVLSIVEDILKHKLMNAVPGDVHIGLAAHLQVKREEFASLEDAMKM